ncbi:MAG TPA: EF-hand domain-containing protein [Pusillimonas sp.]|uniref:EF-hand domain-containing protein n=1 Tax=Pusillimonas sp. TaxID=3040095 RepID=UPI002C2A4AA1|nr:EF-hand domain-containing protein [Pusillimonas sp.]HUH88833.1 EF-hand domain-containing protein [Pusillimonas sp.]
MKIDIIKPVASLALALVLGFSGTAYAQGASAAELTPEHFKALDRNNSGGVSKDEYEQFMRESFLKLDTDGNKRLSKAEASAVLTPEQFAAVDKDHSGELTLDEFLDHVMRDFDRYDYNNDGVLTP